MAATPEWEVTNSGTAQQPPSALVARMFGVTMLEFRTDHPLHEVRVTVNGTVLGSLSISAVDNQTTLKLAAVVSQRQGSATIYLDTVNYASDFTTAYPPMQDARDGLPTEYDGPGKDVKIPESGWLEVYRLFASRFKGAEATQYELKVEIR